MTEQEYIKKITSLEGQITSKDGIISEAIKMMDIFNAQIESLTKKVALLEKRLAAAEQNNIHKNSSNSSLAPSQDFNKKKRTNNREKSTKKQGGQPGHQPHILKMSDTPHKRIPIIPKACCSCGKRLNLRKKILIDSKQEIDIPAVEAIISQFDKYQISCSCGHVSNGKFPNRLKAKVQYGARTRALVSYLSVFQYIPFLRIKELFKTCFNLKIAKATLSNSIKRSAKIYKKSHLIIKNFVKNSPVVGADETHIKINGAKGYLWVWQNSKATFITCENNRKKDNIYKHFPNGFPFAVLISDRYSSQLSTPAKAHQICWVHLLRHLKFLKESENNSWIRKLRKLFERAKILDQQKKIWKSSDRKTKKLEYDLDKLLLQKLNKSDFKYTEILRKSLIKNRDTLFTFLYYEACSFHNNDAERAIRNAKVKMKVSLQFKTGGQFYAIIRSVVDTLIKNKLPVFQSLFLLEQGKNINLGIQ